MTSVWLRKTAKRIHMFGFIHSFTVKNVLSPLLSTCIPASFSTWHIHALTLLDWNVTNPQTQPKCWFSLLHMRVLTLISLISNYCIVLPPPHDLKHRKFFSLSQVINKTVVSECSSEWLWTEIQFEDKNL